MRIQIKLTHTYTHIHAHTHTSAHTHAHTHTHTHVHTHTHTHPHTMTHRTMQAYARIHECTKEQTFDIITSKCVLVRTLWLIVSNARWIHFFLTKPILFMQNYLASATWISRRQRLTNHEGNTAGQRVDSVVYRVTAYQGCCSEGGGHRHRAAPVCPRRHPWTTSEKWSET